MPTTLETLPKGHEFPPTPFDLTRQWVDEYIHAVEDEAIAGLGADVVPPMAIAALSIRALLEQAGLPPGAVHLGQELDFQGTARVGDRLLARARIASRGERQGWVLMGVEMSVQDGAGDPLMAGRATVTFPLQPGSVP